MKKIIVEVSDELHLQMSIIAASQGKKLAHLLRPLFEKWTSKFIKMTAHPQAGRKK